MDTRKPQNLFFTTTFWLILLGGILYSKPIALSIIDRGFTPDRGFDLTYGLIFGAIATMKKMEDESIYTPDECMGIPLLGRNKIDVIKQQIIQPALEIAQTIQPIAQAINEVQAVKEVISANPIDEVIKMVAPNDQASQIIKDVANIANPVDDVAEIAKMVAPNDPTVQAIANIIEDPFSVLRGIKL